MKFEILRCGMVAAALAMAGCATATNGVRGPAGKNVYDVKYAPLPGNYAMMLKNAPDEWNFNFRPYGASSEWLWSDSNVRRDAAADGKLSDRRITAIRVSCDEQGFNVLMYGCEPSLSEYLSKTNDYPYQSIEYFVAPGDADEPGVQQRFMCFYGNGENREYENREPDRQFRLAKPVVSETALENSVVVKISYDWANFWNRLPLFTDRTDNFWRLSLIRWVEGGLTWGGTVHQNSQAGYIRWPAFTPAERTAILKTTLEKGWREFRKYTHTNPISIGLVTANWLPCTELRRKLDPRSFVNMNEDPDFCPTLERMILERRALAPEIARMDKMTREEQDAFYAKASEMLFNFPWALQEAYGEYQKNRLFER